MNNIVFKHISKSYGDKKIVKDLNMTINEGERLILLGPSGCGKTTTLRMIAGLESISGGKLEMGGKVVNDLTPGERNIAMVFQNYALFPHLSVWENIVFGLKIKGLAKDEIKLRASTALEILNLKGFENYKPKELSGGQKQRVALCRALVKQSPYFLLDEPLSNLDAQLRQQARTELVKIHEIYKPTMIYVTHDQVEAMTVADRIAVLNHGDLQQIGTPEEIYNKPANTFVASFIGTPAMNLLRAKVFGDKVLLGNNFVTVPKDKREIIATRETIIIGIRPERCQASETPFVLGKIAYVENLGDQRIARIELEGAGQIYLSTGDYECDLAKAKGFSFNWQDVSLFDEESGENLCK